MGIKAREDFQLKISPAYRWHAEFIWNYNSITFGGVFIAPKESYANNIMKIF